MSEENMRLAIAAVRKAFKAELVAALGADRVTGIDTKIVPATRSIRPHSEDREPTPLLFAGQPYAMLRLGNVQALHYTTEPAGKRKKIVSIDRVVVGADVLREVWDATVATHFPEGRITAGDKEHVILDPEFKNNRAMFGLTGLTIPVTVRPLPPRPVSV